MPSAECFTSPGVSTPGKYSSFIRHSFSFTCLSFALLKHWGEMLQAQVQTLEAQWDTDRQRVEALEAERQRVEALEAQWEAEQRQMAEVLHFLQGLGAATGVVPPPSLFTPPPAAPPHMTPVSMNMIVLSLYVHA
jgi:hypothetical protein